MTDFERVIKIVDWLIFKGVIKNRRELADKLGYTESSLSQILNGKVPLSDKFIKKLSIYEDLINLSWIKTGEGSMLQHELLSPGKKSTDDQILLSDLNLTIAPLISQYAYAGYLSEFDVSEFLCKQPKYVATQKYGSDGNYVAFEVRDDSMNNKSSNAICNGDIVLGQGIPQELWSSKLLIPKVFVVVHKVEGILLREVIEHDVEQGTITCSAYNPDRVRFPNTVLNLKEVLGVFGVKELKRGGF